MASKSKDPVTPELPALTATNDSDSELQTKARRRTAGIQLAALCFTLFLIGWNDGTLGPLLPRIQESYGIGYTPVSVLFIFSSLGCCIGAMSNIWLTPKFGFGKVGLCPRSPSKPSQANQTIIFGSLCQVVAYAVQASGVPFPVFVLAGFINGIGLAMQDAQSNGYVASVPSNRDNGVQMGIVQASYGVGALVAPFVSTQFGTRARFAVGKRWAWQYLVSLGVALVNTVVLGVVFRGRTQDECLAQIGHTLAPEQPQPQTEPEKDSASPDPVPEMPSAEPPETKSHFKQIMALRAVHVLAIFLTVYVGVEVTIGSWIVSFLINVRHGGPNTGYVSSGFFGGLTLGRVVLLPLNNAIGEYRAIFLYNILVIALELVIWLVPSLIGGALAVSFVGMLLGPMYPIAMNHAGRVFPPHLIMGIIGWTTGIATGGAAAIPFATGAIAGAGGKGIKTLEPVVVAMLVVMLARFDAFSCDWSTALAAIPTRDPIRLSTGTRLSSLLPSSSTFPWPNSVMGQTPSSFGPSGFGFDHNARCPPYSTKMPGAYYDFAMDSDSAWDEGFWDPDADHYTLLRVPEDASQEDIRRAFRRLAVKYHPDKNLKDPERANQQFGRLKTAYDTLFDEQKRVAYDRSRRQPPSQPHAAHTPAHHWQESAGASFIDELSRYARFPTWKWPELPTMKLRSEFSWTAPLNTTWVIECANQKHWNGFGDDADGFFAFYSRVFARLQAGEDVVSDSRAPLYPPFGNSSWPWESTLKTSKQRTRARREGDFKQLGVVAFYNTWENFATARYADANVIQGRRAVNYSDKYWRSEARWRYDCAVRALAEWIRCLDPRCPAP
uniref:MFS general substrate transporter n=1 Tax=Mycena chlorophos TaxID=658473 RepID=A0ABQ0LGR5_MYCCL|nr:MFS general substrate transporter [Mycena chlorophos]